MRTVMSADYNGVLGRHDEKVTFGQKILMGVGQLPWKYLEKKVSR